jgi:hydroxymethylbilane synthase
VHSMKDLPTALPQGIVLAAVPERGNTRDALVLALPNRPVRKIGSSSLRRRAMVKRQAIINNTQCPELEHVRGNVNSRLRKLDEGQYDALVLACAGLERLGLQDRISQTLQGEEWKYYAVCQGAIAVVCREDDSNLRNILQKINQQDTLIQCYAERAFLATLEGGCKVPIGVNTEIKDSVLHIAGIVLSLDGVESVEHNEHVQLNGDNANDLAAAEEVGKRLANNMLLKGADKILKDIRSAVENDTFSNKS